MTRPIAERYRWPAVAALLLAAAGLSQCDAPRARVDVARQAVGTAEAHLSDASAKLTGRLWSTPRSVSLPDRRTQEVIETAIALTAGPGVTSVFGRGPFRADVPRLAATADCSELDTAGRFPRCHATMTAIARRGDT